MGDAEIIPIGTRGKPGRGTGEAKPSSNSRSLAAKGPAKAASKPAPGTAPASLRRSPTRRRMPRPDARRGPGRSNDDAKASRDDHAAPQPAPKPRHRSQRRPAEPSSPRARPTVLTRAPVTADHRHPTPGIPPLEWLSAFTSASKELFGENWEPRLAEFLAFLRRRLTGDYAVDDYGFDREVTEQFLLAAMRPIARKWFRVEVRGAENIPAEGGALVVSNHSGTVPVDGMMTAVSIHDHTGRFLRPLGADLVFRLPVIGDLARKGGATLACNEDAERMLRGGELVGRLARGLQGHRQAVQRALQAAAVRPRWLRLGGDPDRRTHHPDLGRGCRGDLPARGQHPLARPAARRPLPADHAVVPAARPAGADPAAVEVADRVR